MKLFGWGDAAPGLPPDRLRPEQLAIGAQCLLAASGVPLASDCCAYEPTQRLLAVSALAAGLCTARQRRRAQEARR
jgi:hypothetical protein